MSDNDAFYVGLGHFVIILLCVTVLLYLLVSINWVWVCHSEIKQLREDLNKIEDKIFKLKYPDAN